MLFIDDSNPATVLELWRLVLMRVVSSYQAIYYRGTLRALKVLQGGSWIFFLLPSQTMLDYYSSSVGSCHCCAFGKDMKFEVHIFRILLLPHILKFLLFFQMPSKAEGTFKSRFVCSFVCPVYSIRVPWPDGSLRLLWVPQGSIGLLKVFLF